MNRRMTHPELATKAGQNTAEYLIMLTLIAVASIGLFSVFGKTLRHKIEYVTAAISGESATMDKAEKAASKATSEALMRADREVSVKGAEKDELSYKDK